jgi:hypothetical protein
MVFGARDPFGSYGCAACDTLQIMNLSEDEELTRHLSPG